MVRACDISDLGPGQLDELVALTRDGQRALEAFLVGISERAQALARDGTGPGAAELLVGRGEVSSAQARHDAARVVAVEGFATVRAALATGELGGEHLDALHRLTANLSDPERVQVQAADAAIAAAARRGTVESFKRWLRALVRQVQAEHRATTGADIAGEDPAMAEPSLRAWKGRDGRGHLTLEVDPITHELLLNLIEAHKAAQERAAAEEQVATQERTAETTVTAKANVAGQSNETGRISETDQANETGKADQAGSVGGQLAELHQRAARALIDLLLNPSASGRATTGRAAITILVDAHTALYGIHPGTVCETSGGTPVPFATADRFACDAVIRKTVIGPGGAPMDVGRRSRTATHSQWAMLTALYSSCAWHGCDRPLAWCQAHHLHPWEHHGPTDLQNLLPLCNRHHHLAHEGGWRLKLLADRTLEHYTPDGSHWRTSRPDRLTHWLTPPNHTLPPTPLGGQPVHTAAA